VLGSREPLDRHPRTMRAVRIHEPGGASCVAMEELAAPRVRPGTALVRIHAAALTPGELEWPSARLPAIPSYELSGVIEDLAPGADLAVGAAVYGMAAFDADGVAAELAVLPAAFLAPKPKTLGHLESAALPLAGLSAWQGLFVHGGLEPGERVLIDGAAGGVGHLAIQLARWRGAHVIGTASRANRDLVRELGAHEVLDGSTRRIGSVDLLFDTAGSELLRSASEIVRPRGRVVSVAEEPPEMKATAPLAATYFVVEPHREQLVRLAELADAGVLRPMIDSVYPLDRARAAFERTQARGKRGKVVLRVQGGDDA